MRVIKINIETLIMILAFVGLSIIYKLSLPATFISYIATFCLYNYIKGFIRGFQEK
jgi:hypothetical protein